MIPSLTSAPYLVVSYSIPKGCLIGLSLQVVNTELQNGMKIQVKFRRQSDLGCLIVYILPKRLFLVVLSIILQASQKLFGSHRC